jgi:hypothetical protein
LSVSSNALCLTIEAGSNYETLVWQMAIQTHALLQYFV